MAFIHTWDTLNRKPNYPVAIDWRNGHSKGLVFVCLDLGDGNYYSIIQRGFSSITAGTAPTTAAHPHRWIGRSTLHNVTAAPYFPVATFTNIDITEIGRAHV